MYVCMYVYRYALVYIYICICMYVCVCVYIYIYIYIYTCMHVCKDALASVLVCVPSTLSTSMCVCVCIYIYIYIHVYHIEFVCFYNIYIYMIYILCAFVIYIHIYITEFVCVHDMYFAQNLCVDPICVWIQGSKDVYWTGVKHVLGMYSTCLNCISTIVTKLY